MSEYAKIKTARTIICDLCNELHSDEPCEPADCDWLRMLEEDAGDVAPVQHGRWTMSSDRPDTIICTCCDSTFELGTDEMGVQMIDIGPADEELQKHIRQFLQLVAGFMGWYGHGE